MKRDDYNFGWTNHLIDIAWREADGLGKIVLCWVWLCLPIGVVMDGIAFVLRKTRKRQ